MRRRPVHYLAMSLSTLLVVGVSADLHGQEAADAPVRKELDALREKSAKSAPPERTRAYEQGIDEVRKSGVPDKALKVGDRAHEFTLPDATGKVVKLSELLAQGPVVVTWYRGAWCPYCNVALRGFQRSLPEIRSAGANLVAISPQTPDNSLSTVEKGRLEFAILSDRGNKVAHAYGVAFKVPKVITEQMKGRLDLAKYNGDESGELPLGATYVIDRDGVIRYAFVDADYRKRAEPADVIAALRGLQKKP